MMRRILSALIALCLMVGIASAANVTVMKGIDLVAVDSEFVQ